MAHEANERALTLPDGLSSRGDLSRVIRELEELEKFLQETAIRQPGSHMQLPKTSRLFEQLVSDSKLNMLDTHDREYLMQSLNWLRDHAPVMHISFSSDPSPLFMQKLTVWLRQHISPFVFLQIGLQPNIGAGCMVRSTNKYFDFSLRKRFESKRDLLMKELIGQPAAAAAPATNVPAVATSLQVSPESVAAPIVAQAPKPAMQAQAAPASQPAAQTPAVNSEAQP